MNLQADYGGFDPLFPGVTIDVGSTIAWKFFDVATQAAMSGEAWKESDDSDTRFESLSVQTAFIHEFRHFHDALITPYSARAFGLRLRQMVHTYQILTNLEEADFNCIPVPLSRWCMLDEEERKLVIRRSGKHPSGAPWQLPPLPPVEMLVHLDPSTRPKTSPYGDMNALARLVCEGWWDQQRILKMAQRAPGKNPKLPHPWQIMELSALTVQLEQMFAKNGAEAAVFFESRLRDLTENPYGHILQLAQLAWNRLGENSDFRILSGIATWCLLGSFTLDGAKADPAFRFECLFIQMCQQGPPALPKDWRPVWDSWSREFGVSTVFDGLEDSAHYWQKSVAIAEEVEKHAVLHSEHSQMFARATKNYAKASELMIRKFRQNPNAYTDPPSYLRNMAHWSDPLIRYSFPLQPLILSKDFPDLLNGKITPHVALDMGESLYVSSLVAQADYSKWTTLGVQDALSLFKMFVFLEMLFSEASDISTADRNLAVYEYFDKDVVPLKVFRLPSKKVLEALSI